jgi:chaperonin GroES
MIGRILPTKILLRESPKEEKKTASGIIIPDAVIQTPTSMAIAVLVGEGTNVLPMIVKCGDKVLFSPHATAKVRIDDEDFLLLDIKDVFYIY